MRWRPWVIDCTRLLDGDGTFAHWPKPGAYGEQPAFDITILDIIRHKWNELRNADMQEQTHNGRKS